MADRRDWHRPIVVCVCDGEPSQVVVERYYVFDMQRVVNLVRYDLAQVFFWEALNEGSDQVASDAVEEVLEENNVQRLVGRDFIGVSRVWSGFGSAGELG